MKAYTRGPWEIVDSFYPSFKEIRGPSFKVSVVMYATDLDESDYSSRMGDLRLMSAAPDLYEALEEALAELKLYSLELAGEDYNSPKINNALAKARGE